MVRKLIMTVAAIVILLSGLSVQALAVAGEPSAWAKVAVEEAIKNGFVPENLQSNYQQPITREEFASLFVQTIFALQKINFPERPEHAPFELEYAVTREDVLRQVKATDYAFTDTGSENVKLAYILGLVNGTSATTFSPKNLVTRQEAAVMLAAYGSPEGYGLSDKDNLEHFMPRYTDFNKAASWAKEYLNLAFFRGVFNGTTGDREWEGTSKITLDPLGNFTREQAISVAYRLYEAQHKTFITSINLDTVYLRGCVPFMGDDLGITWEVTKSTITAISLSEELKEAQNTGYHTAIIQTKQNYISVFRNGWKSNESMVAAYWRIGMPSQLISYDAMRDIITGRHAIYDIGLAEYEANNPRFVFQVRFKGNGFYDGGHYGGAKMLPIECKLIQ